MANKKYTTRTLVLRELPGNLPGDIYKTTTLNGTLTAAGTVITVTSLSGFPSIGDLLIDSELIEYLGTDAAGTQLTTVTRGAWNTTSSTHANAAVVYNGYLDRSVEKMTAYVDTILGQRYQSFPDYSATGSCPEVIEQITRNLVAHEARIDMGIRRNVGEGMIEDTRYNRALAMLKAIAEGRQDIGRQIGTVALAFGTDRDSGTLPLGLNEAFLSHRSVLADTVVVTNNGTTYVRNDDYSLGWDEDRQKWVLWRAQSDKITDNATATYDYTWMRSYLGKTPVDQQRTRVTNVGRIHRGP